MRIGHLQDTEFADYLTGCATGEAEAHLAGCGVCRREAAQAQDVLRDLRVATSGWSEGKAACLRRSAGQSGATFTARGSFVRTPRAVFAALLLAVALPSGIYASVQAERAAASERRVRAEAARQAQIARDNDLLQSVDRELAEQVAPAMQPLQVDRTETNTEEER